MGDWYIHEASVEVRNKKTGKTKWVRVGRCNNVTEARKLAVKKAGRGWRPTRSEVVV